MRNRYPNQQRGGYTNRPNFDRDNRNNGNPPFKRRANDQFPTRNNNSNYDNNQDPNNMQTKRIRKYDDQYQQPQSISLPPDLEAYKSLVLLSNLAHKATREDILDLIQSFNPIEDTLKIRHTDYGKPTGDAIVAFKTINDAHNACKMLDGSMFIGRRLKVILHKKEEIC
jgi:RNA recognition motif-containing protein